MEASDAVDERAIDVADQVLETLREDAKQTRQIVETEIQSLREKFDETLDMLSRRSDFNRLVAEVNQLSEEMGNYVNIANKVLSTTMSDMGLDMSQISERVRGFDERLGQALNGFDDSVKNTKPLGSLTRRLIYIFPIFFLLFFFIY